MSMNLIRLTINGRDFAVMTRCFKGGLRLERRPPFSYLKPTDGYPLMSRPGPRPLGGAILPEPGRLVYPPLTARGGFFIGVYASIQWLIGHTSCDVLTRPRQASSVTLLGGLSHLTTRAQTRRFCAQFAHQTRQ